MGGFFKSGILIGRGNVSSVRGWSPTGSMPAPDRTNFVYEKLTARAILRNLCETFYPENDPRKIKVSDFLIEHFELSICSKM